MVKLQTREENSDKLWRRDGKLCFARVACEGGQGNI